MRLTIPFPADKRLSLEITLRGKYIKGITFSLSGNDNKNPGSSQNRLFENSSPLAQHIHDEFFNYFNDPAYRFSLEYQLEKATVFQQRVWQALTMIPGGEVRTYSELADLLGSSPRAVGNACRMNPLPIMIPCHRVVSVAGIGGYAGDSVKNQKGPINYLAIKQWLLAHEQGLLAHEQELVEHEKGLLKDETAKPE